MGSLARVAQLDGLRVVDIVALRIVFHAKSRAGTNFQDRSERSRATEAEDRSLRMGEMSASRGTVFFF